MEELKNPEVSEELENQQTEIAEPHPLDDEGSQRFLRSIQSVEKDNNIFEALTDFLASGQPYMVAMNISREVNHKQGKLRFNMTTDKRELMRDPETDINTFLNNQLDKIFLEMINQFILTHPLLPNMSKRNESKIVDMMKILYIMLLSNGQFDVVVQLKTPEFIKPYLSKALQHIDESAEIIVNEWYNYLKKEESEEMAEKAKTIGISFFSGSKAIDTFDKYFRNYITMINHYEGTYDKYLELRKQYQLITTDLSAKSLFKFFEISDDTFFEKRNKYLIPEFQAMFTEEDYKDPLRLLIFGNE